MKTIPMLILVAAGLAVAAPAHAMKKLFVGNLHYGTTAAQVEHHAARFGAVMSIRVVAVDEDGEQFSEAVVAYHDPRVVDVAARALDGRVIRGRRIVTSVMELLVVGSKVKDVIRSAGFRSDGDLVQAVSDKVYEILESAIARAGANKRGTVRPYDL